MKTPRFLIAAVLVFWGWQTGFLAIGIVMALVLEAAAWTKMRWDFSDDDFSRIWTICTLLFLGVTVYAFTDNGGPARFGHLLQNPGPVTQTGASAVTARTASTMLRWLPMVLFLFVAAQAYSSREEIPISTISLFLRRRWKKAMKLGRPMPPQRGVNVSYPYFAICLFAASVHPGEDNTYFWGFCVLMGWVLLMNRSRRFSTVLWASVLLIAFTGGYFGQYGVGRLQSYIQNLDSQWLQSLLRRGGTDASISKTQIGRIGQLKLSGKVVIRLKSQDGALPPEYLREASYRLYGRRSSSSWSDGASRENFQLVPQETNNGAFILIGKTNFARARITCYLDGYSHDSGSPAGLLPLPSGSGRLENLRAFVLKMNNLGAVLAEGPGLVSFTAAYGPGPTMDSAFDSKESRSFTNRYRGMGTNEVFIGNPDLFIPEPELPALTEVTTNWNVPFGNRPAALRAVGEFFRDHFTYSTWQQTGDFRTTNQTALGLFLTRTHSGHCEYFATATVLLLRKLGVPARYAVGYAVHEKSGGEYIVRLRDAHSWCLVWNEKARTWQDFDTTPASWVEEEGKNASPFQSISDLWSWLGFQFSKFRWGQSNFRQYMLIGLIPVMGLLAYQVFFRQKRKRRNEKMAAGDSISWPGLDSEFYLIEKKLAERGIVRRTNEPLSDWLNRALADPALSEAAKPLKELLRLHYRYRFDPEGLTQPDREAFRQAVHASLETLKAGELKRVATP